MAKYATQNDRHDYTSQKRARARQKALTRLADKYRDEFEQLYAEERQAEGLK